MKTKILKFSMEEVLAQYYYKRVTRKGEYIHYVGFSNNIHTNDIEHVWKHLKDAVPRNVKLGHLLLHIKKFMFDKLFSEAVRLNILRNILVNGL